jgi:hypothetical protein
MYMIYYWKQEAGTEEEPLGFSGSKPPEPLILIGTYESSVLTGDWMIPVSTK